MNELHYGAVYGYHFAEYPTKASERTLVQETKPVRGTESSPSVRKLKIEDDGGLFKGQPKPKIRLMGRWLERAGFRPGCHVEVICVAPGLIQLCSRESKLKKLMETAAS